MTLDKYSVEFTGTYEVAGLNHSVEPGCKKALYEVTDDEQTCFTFVHCTFKCHCLVRPLLILNAYIGNNQDHDTEDNIL